MARRADGRVNSTDRTKRYTPDTFEDGSAVRRLAAQPQEAPKEARPLKSGVSSQTRRNCLHTVYRGVCCVCQVADRGYHAGGRHYQQRKRIERSEGGQ